MRGPIQFTYMNRIRRVIDLEGRKFGLSVQGDQINYYSLRPFYNYSCFYLLFKRYVVTLPQLYGGRHLDKYFKYVN